MESTLRFEKISALIGDLTQLTREYEADADLVGGESDSHGLRQTLSQHRDRFQDIDGVAEGILKGALSNGIAPNGRRWGEIKQQYAGLQADFAAVCRQVRRKEANAPLRASVSVESEPARGVSHLYGCMNTSGGALSVTPSGQLSATPSGLLSATPSGHSTPQHCPYYMDTSGGPLSFTPSGHLSPTPSRRVSATPQPCQYLMDTSGGPLTTTTVSGRVSATPSRRVSAATSEYEYIDTAEESFVEDSATEDRLPSCAPQEPMKKTKSGCFSFFRK